HFGRRRHHHGGNTRGFEAARSAPGICECFRGLVGRGSRHVRPSAQRRSFAGSPSLVCTLVFETWFRRRCASAGRGPVGIGRESIFSGDASTGVPFRGLSSHAASHLFGHHGAYGRSVGVADVLGDSSGSFARG